MVTVLFYLVNSGSVMANKMKSHSGAAKRFKITKGKKVMTSKSCNNHLLTNKGKTNKKFAYGKELCGAVAKMIKNLLPYN
ncbi:MAG: 50S ribosomal protein L35 [bacterium]|nr:50S ribosomal protein L35 [bacterium]